MNRCRLNDRVRRLRAYKHHHSIGQELSKINATPFRDLTFFTHESKWGEEPLQWKDVWVRNLSIPKGGPSWHVPPRHEAGRNTHHLQKEPTAGIPSSGLKWIISCHLRDQVICLADYLTFWMSPSRDWKLTASGARCRPSLWSDLLDVW